MLAEAGVRIQVGGLWVWLQSGFKDLSVTTNGVYYFKLALDHHRPVWPFEDTAMLTLDLPITEDRIVLPGGLILERDLCSHPLQVEVICDFENYPHFQCKGN